MQTMTATEARANLFHLVERSNKTHQPVHITSRNGGAVLLAEGDFEELIETLELLSTPGVLRGVREAKKDIRAGRTYSIKDVFK